MGKIKLFRIWFYFRTGYQLYFAFVFAAINTMVITYFLAIERAPFLKEIFPTFGYYAMMLISIGLPILIITGFLHFKKIPAYKSEQEVAVESNPYQYKVPPGWWIQVIMPYLFHSSTYLTKLAKKENFSDEDFKEMSDLRDKIKILLDGGYVGAKGRTLSFGQDKKI